MQILINLIRNAKHAGDAANPADDRITIRITAKELGGALMAHSDGAGLGAVFTLVIPSLADPSSDPKADSSTAPRAPHHFLQDQTA